MIPASHIQDLDYHQYILIKGARQHNLKNFDLAIPKDKLVVIKGFQARVNHLWLSIPFLLKASDAI